MLHSNWSTRNGVTLTFVNGFAELSLIYPIAKVCILHRTRPSSLSTQGKDITAEETVDIRHAGLVVFDRQDLTTGLALLVSGAGRVTTTENKSAIRWVDGRFCLLVSN